MPLFFTLLSQASHEEVTSGAHTWWALFLFVWWACVFLYGSCRIVGKLRLKLAFNPNAQSYLLPIEPLAPAFGGKCLPMLFFLWACFYIPMLVQKTCLHFGSAYLPTARAERVFCLTFLGQIVWLLLYRCVGNYKYNRTSYAWLQAIRLGFQSYCELIPCLLLLVLFKELCVYGLRQLNFNFEPTMQPIVSLLLEGQLSSWPLFIAFVSVTVLAPICEEMLFRGLIFNFLASKVSRMFALLGSSLLFAAMHFHLDSFIYLFFLGVWLCVTYYKSGNIWVNIVVHALFNGSNFLCLLILSDR